MPVETATFIDDLVATNPLSSDETSRGDDHIRLIKSTLLATFPNISAAVTATAAEINGWEARIDALETGTFSTLEIDSTAPLMDWFDSDGAASEKRWRVSHNSGIFEIRTVTDAEGVGNTALKLDRTGTNVDSVVLSATGGGTVNVDANGVGLSGTTIALAGDVQLSAPLAVTEGGTGGTTQATARSGLGLGSIATQASSNVTITGGSISGITDLAVADGGTGASTASAARTNLSTPVIPVLGGGTGNDLGRFACDVVTAGQGSFTLPTGGVWAWFYVCTSASSNSAAGVNSGGVAISTPGEGALLFWRVS